MRTLSRAVAAVAALYAGLVQGAPVKYCASNGICFQVGVPEASARSGSGNIFFQISAPTKYSWVALGTGDAMAGSNIFLMYQDGHGNVTLSPRLGTKYTMPTLDTSSGAAKLTLLQGSGVSADGSTMTANVACANCETWNGGSGSIKLTSSSSGWIAAWKSGSSLATTDKSASISRHDSAPTFKLDLTKATLTSDSNPFVKSASSGQGASMDSGGTESGSNTGEASNGGVIIFGGKPKNDILTAHGIMMAVVFVIMYPLGSMLMPVLGKWTAHAGFQYLSFIAMWVAFGLGVKVANDYTILFKQTHTIFGTVIVCLMVVQPALGYMHHRNFVRTGGRTPVSYGHIFYGRAMMILGIINGGLGLKLSRASNDLMIAYGVVSGIMFLAYTITMVWGSFWKKRNQQQVIGGLRANGGSLSPQELVQTENKGSRGRN